MRHLNITNSTRKESCHSYEGYTCPIQTPPARAANRQGQQKGKGSEKELLLLNITNPTRHPNITHHELKESFQYHELNESSKHHKLTNPKILINVTNSTDLANSTRHELTESFQYHVTSRTLRVLSISRVMLTPTYVEFVMLSS